MDAVNVTSLPNNASYHSGISLPTAGTTQPGQSTGNYGQSVAGGISNERELKTAELEGRKVTAGDEEVVKALEKVKKAMIGGNTTLEFSIHKETKAIMVKVLDKDTGQVIKEIPPEKIEDLVAKLCEMAGIYVDKKV